MIGDIRAPGEGVFESLSDGRRFMRRALDAFRVVAAREPRLIEGAKAPLEDAERLHRELQCQLDIAERSLHMAHDLGTQLSARLAHANTVISRNLTKE